MMSLPARVVLVLVHAYQMLLGPFTGGVCRFEPSCSNYATKAVAEHGALAGGLLALKRVARCHPFAEPGFDPVPPRSGQR